MSFPQQLYKIKKEMEKHHNSKENVLYESVQRRLNDALVAYNDEMDSYLKYLSNRQPDGILRRLSRR